MNKTHIMLDLETWGRTPGSDIRSIGAVVFDPVAGLVNHRAPDGGSSQFYVATENEEQRNGWKGLESPATFTYRKYNLTRDPETVQWWNDQSAEAQAAFENPVDLKLACMRLADWLGSVHMEMNIQGVNQIDENLLIWCNGPHFDEAILAAVYRAVGLPVPWHYRAPRDFRTITDAAGMTHDDFVEFNHGTSHNAVDDAISQALIVCEAYKRLGLQR